MATRFVRVDLSDEARDFRPLAVEPGVPLLDRSNANAKIVFRWLGGMAAEPVWQGDSVSFFVRDDHGGRLEEVACQPAAADDLEGPLKQDLTTLNERLEKARPETSTERAVHQALLRSLGELVENPNRTDLDDYFFRYRDVQGRWRLVWAWGYQRVDQEPAPAVVCTDPDCGLLFVRRPGQSHKCPSCEAALATRPVKRRSPRRVGLLVLLLLLLAGGLFYWWSHPARLVAAPDRWTGPVGARIAFRVTRTGLFSSRDVSRQAVPVVLDPQVARIDPVTGTAVAVGLGETVVRFHLGDLKSDVSLVVGEARNPDKLIIEPRSVELGVGTTARLKLVGHYKDGTEIDLTDAAEWAAQNDGVVFACDGLIEGLAPGGASVSARYRAGPADKYMEAAANVSVSNIDFKSLDLAIDPTPVAVGRASRLTIDAVSDEGKRYSVLESSLLSTEITPQYLAEAEGQHLKGRHAGRAKLAATFNDRLTAGTQFTVAYGAGLDSLTVYPEKLDLVVGQIADLSIASPGTAPIRVKSSDPSAVEVAAGNRLVGRKEGKATVEVSQGDQRRTVAVSVKTARFRSIAVAPGRVVVVVDDTTRPRVTARTEEGRTVEIAPDVVTVEKAPSPRFADLDPRTLALRGVMPTTPSAPQSLGVRLAEHTAEAPVEVVVAPFRLAVEPRGPIELPLGQQMRLAGVATYSGGRRVLVRAERLKWDAEPAAGAAPGLELRGEKVAALKAGGGSLSVFATYFNKPSNRVEFRSVEADPDLRLRVEVDRTLRLAGEAGQAVLAASGPKGDVELVAELAAFQCSDEGVLRIDEKSGAFRAEAPGAAIITASHAAAREPASARLNVYDPAQAELVFLDAPSVRTSVDEVGRLRLYLVIREGGKTVDQAPLVGPGVGFGMSQPQAIGWNPPTLVGLQPTAPFELSASYYPHLASTASASVEVTPAAKPEAIRVVPAEPKLAPGQMVALKVEQQLPGQPNQWKEVRPDAVTWTVPTDLIWSPATEDLRPMATVPEGAPAEFELKAAYGGKQAAAIIRVKDKPRDPDAPGSRLVLSREPEGQYLAVGRQQRYTVMIENENPTATEAQREPAANVAWPGDFENDYVRWQAPVLTAKRPGYRQWLRAEVGGRTVLFSTVTYQPADFDRPAPRSDAPVAVKIVSDQGPAVRMPVGAQFDDFRVEAHYADGFTRLVTRKAVLRTPEPPDSAPVSASGGRLVGVRPGRTAVSAEFDGVASKQPLEVEVTGQVDVDEIRLAPSPVAILPGETVALDAVGYKDGRSVGILTGMSGLEWQSGDPSVAQVSGPALTGIGLGQAAVTAALGSVVSEPNPVSVVPTIADPLTFDPGLLRIRVGESARIGTDVAVFRGPMDLSGQCRITPALPGVVRYVPETHSLVGVAPGVSSVAFAFGDKLANLTVEVLPQSGAIDGTVVVEPAAATLAPGQAVPLRVIVVGPAGERIDRTDSAVLTSSDATQVKVLGNRACAVAPGSARITATLPGTESTGTAYVAVADEPITGLVVDPPRLNMSVGDLARLRVLGQAATGAYELYPQSDLAVAAAGPNPEAIRIVGAADIDAVTPGEAAVSVGWQNRLAAEVPVSVSNNPLGGLRIEPGDATIVPGQPIVYQVTGVRGGQRRVLGPEDGVQLFAGDQQVAEVIDAMAVRGNQPGRTSVVAQLGNQRAEAVLNVAAGGDVAIASDTTVYGPGYGYYGGPGGWRGRGWRGGGWHVRGGGPAHVYGGGVDVYGPPAAEVAGLRFVPDVLRLPTGSPGAAVRVVEVLADGTLGRDVTADPDLELTDPPNTAKVDRTEAGPVIRPVAPGEVRIGAKLGLLTADPLLVSVGDYALAGARLVAEPDPLMIWSGELGSFSSVRVDPGYGQMPVDVDYKITPAANQGVVASEGAKLIRGLSNGATQVVVTAVDPSGVYDGLSTTAAVQVISPDRLRIEPSQIALQVGQSTPPMAVVAQGQDGLSYQVPATLESLDPSVLAPDPESPGRFVAQSYGGTQVRAEYRGREVFAAVTVAGKRFESVVVDDVPESRGESFHVGLRVSAAASEGPLEYRVSAAGQSPDENWVAAEPQGQSQQAILRSPPIRYGPPGSLYQLTIESRAAGGGPVQQFPLTFRLSERVERTDAPRTTPQTSTPF